MKKNVSFIIAIFCCVIFNSQAQETKESKFELRIYYNFNKSIFNNEFDFSNYQYEKIFSNLKDYSVGDLSIGLIFQPINKFSHEFELMPFSLNKTKLVDTNISNNPNESPIITGKNSSTISSRFRYQLRYNFYKSQMFNLYSGLSSMIYLNNQNFESFTSLEFPKSLLNTGLIIGITPGIELFLTEKLILNIDVPLGIWGITAGRLKHDSPALNLNEKVKTSIESNFGGQGFQVRAGLGIKI